MKSRAAFEVGAIVTGVLVAITTIFVWFHVTVYLAVRYARLWGWV